MSTLAEVLLVPGKRPKVVDDCVRIVDEEVDSKGGLSGLAIKGAYALVKAVKPGFITESRSVMCGKPKQPPILRCEPTVPCLSVHGFP